MVVFYNLHVYPETGNRKLKILLYYALDIVQ
jgi:hypothetical protein